MNSDETQLRSTIRQFIERNINADEVELADGDNIFSLGYVNSIFAMRLLTFIEKQAAITVADEDILLANFCSVDAMLALIARHRAAGQA
jgi:methoxymalonate biosynthesis acyl carrier protein